MKVPFLKLTGNLTLPTSRHTVKCAKYLLVLVDTFSGWVEAFPTSNKRAQTVRSSPGLVSQPFSNQTMVPNLLPKFLKFYLRP